MFDSVMAGEPASTEAVMACHNADGTERNRLQADAHASHAVPNTAPILTAEASAGAGSGPVPADLSTAALRQLELLGKDPARAWFRTIRHGKGANRSRKGADLHGFDAAALARDSAAGEALYVVIGEASQATGKNAKGRRTGAVTNDDIEAVPALFVEWDKGTVADQLVAWQHLGLPEPTLMLTTGGKSVHAYWRLQQPVTPAPWKAATARLIAHCDSDKSCDNPSRVMRLAGGAYIDKKTGNPTGTCAAIEHEAPEAIYSLEQVLSCLPAPKPAAPPPAPAPLPPAAGGELPPRSLEQIREALACIPQRQPGNNNYGAPMGDRDTLWGLVDAVRKAGGTIEQAIALMEAHSPSATCGWDVEQVARSGDGRKTEKTFWAVAKAHGYDVRRHDLKRPTPTPPMGGEVFIPPDAPGNAPEKATPPAAAQPPATAAERLELLHRRAEKLLADRVAFADRLPILRADASDLALSIRDAELQAMLTAARRRRIHGDNDALGPGDVLEGTPAPWAWDGLVLRGCLNLLVALPKQGKTALAVAMVASWWRRDGEALGRQFDGPCPPVLIVGTDQGSRDWRRMLEPAGLVDHAGRIGGPIVGLFHAGKPLHLDPEGIDRIAAYAQQHPGLLVLIDSLHACIAPLGLREESPEVAMPVAELMEQLEPHGATVVLIHHASKGRAAEGASSASRGSTALPALASQILKLGPASEHPNDRRRVLQTQGREGAPQALVIQREGATWELLGGIDELEREQSIEKTIEALSDLQHRALRAVCDHWEDNRERIGAPQLAELLGQGGKNPGDVVLRALQALERRGLLQSVRQQRPGQGGKAYAFWPVPEAIDAFARVRVGACEIQSDGSDGSVGPPAHEDPERSDLCRIKPSDPNDPNDQKNQSPARTRGKRSVGWSVGSPTDQLPLAGAMPTGPIGSGADAMADDDDPAWGPRPQAVA
jgi:hypothetical protein